MDSTVLPVLVLLPIDTLKIDCWISFSNHGRITALANLTKKEGLTANFVSPNCVRASGFRTVFIKAVTA